MHVAWMKFPQFMMIKKQTNNFFLHLCTLSSVVVVSVHYNFWMESHFTVTSSCDCAIKGKFLHGEKKKWLRDSLAYSDAHSYEPVSEISPCFIENICFTVGTRWRGLSFTISGEIRAYFQPYINQKCANMCFSPYFDLTCFTTFCFIAFVFFGKGQDMWNKLLVHV